MGDTWHLTIHLCLCHVSNIGWSTCLPSVPTLSTYRSLPHTFHVSSKDVPHHPYRRAMCHHCKGDMCHSLVPFHVNVRTPSHHATCHHCKGDMCHSLVPVHVSVRTPSHHAMCHLDNLPTIPTMSFVWSYDLYNQLPRGTVRTAQSSFFCLFGKMNISP
jgi:hypothetical protein